MDPLAPLPDLDFSLPEPGTRRGSNGNGNTSNATSASLTLPLPDLPSLPDPVPAAGSGSNGAPLPARAPRQRRNESGQGRGHRQTHVHMDPDEPSRRANSGRGRGTQGQSRDGGRGRGGRRTHDASQNQATEPQQIERTRDGQVKVSLTTQVRKALESVEDVPEGTETCEICFEPVEVLAVGVCNHKLCHRCSLRLRVLVKNDDCPVCRTPLPEVLLTKDTDINWPAKMPKSSIHVPSWRAYCSSRAVQKVCQRLFALSCPSCDQSCTTHQDLSNHLMRQHQLYFCSLCVQHSTKFPSEYATYTQQDLRTHRKRGDINCPDGHPECGFCRHRYYDNDALHAHLKHEHSHCGLCAKIGKPHEYYTDQRALDKHYREEHVACPHGCFLIAFLNDIELQHHIVEEHMEGRSRAEKQRARALDPATFFDTESAGGRSDRQQGHGEGRGARSRDRNRGNDRRAREIEATTQQQEARMHVDAATAAPDLSEAAFPTLGGGGKNGGGPSAPQAAAPPGASMAAPNSGPASNNFRAAIAGPNMANMAGPSLNEASLVAAVEASWPSLAAAGPPSRRSGPNPAPNRGQGTGRGSASGRGSAASRGGGSSRPKQGGAATSAASSSTMATRAHDYIRPASFKERNDAMRKLLMRSLQSDADFDEFKSLTATFREGHVSADDYFRRAHQLLGDATPRVFGELIALLPNIRLQGLLLQAYNDERHRSQVKSVTLNTRGPRSKVTVTKAGTGGLPDLGLHQCRTCGQLLKSTDAAAHQAHHDPEVESDFPSLMSVGRGRARSGPAVGRSGPSAVSSAWGARR